MSSLAILNHFQQKDRTMEKIRGKLKHKWVLIEFQHDVLKPERNSEQFKANMDEKQFVPYLITNNMILRYQRKLEP